MVTYAKGNDAQEEFQMIIADNSFAAACINTSSVAEMVMALTSPADTYTLRAWELTEADYYAEIRRALTSVLEDQPATVRGFVPCYSADGWSLHAAGSTDEAIADGSAPAIVSGAWN
jgi:hypothetical protein